jgi:hypothetical protein
MNREIHVRFCEGLRVRFPWATHLYPDSIGERSQRNKEVIAATEPRVI